MASLFYEKEKEVFLVKRTKLLPKDIRLELDYAPKLPEIGVAKVPTAAERWECESSDAFARSGSRQEAIVQGCQGAILVCALWHLQCVVNSKEMALAARTQWPW